MTVELVCLSAHYKGDEPDGLNFRVNDPEFEDLGQVLNTLREAWDRMWDEAVTEESRAKLIEDLRGQLRNVSRGGAPRTQEEALLAFANIDLLERKGCLVSDEFNGIVLMYGARAQRN